MPCAAIIETTHCSPSELNLSRPYLWLQEAWCRVASLRQAPSGLLKGKNGPVWMWLLPDQVLRSGRKRRISTFFRQRYRRARQLRRYRFATSFSDVIGAAGTDAGVPVKTGRNRMSGMEGPQFLDQGGIQYVSPLGKLDLLA
jgi:hypothetical protein